MKREDVDEQLSLLASEFLYKFSRFEFALKENNYLRNRKPGTPALPGWKEFATANRDAYQITPEAEALMRADPMYQVVADNGILEWRPVNLRRWPGELGKVVRLAQTVRNNLFHGGKHDSGGWDDPDRTALLLRLAMSALDQIAEQTGLDADYLCQY